MLLPFQGDGLAFLITQGDALGYGLLPFQGVLGHFDAVRFCHFQTDTRQDYADTQQDYEAETRCHRT